MTERNMTHMRRWAKQNNYSYAKLAAEMHQSKANVGLKMRGLVAWQETDLKYFALHHGLSSDFVLRTDSLLSEHRKGYPEEHFA
jgi:hypothetical protein